MKIFLIGMMGSGKSTVGKLLSEKLNFKFIDLDSLIETKEGKSISDIFHLNGEPYFRKLESKLLSELKVNNSVIACGGGIVLDESNRHFLKSQTTIFLNSSMDELSNRIAFDTKRPLIQGVEPEIELTRIWKERKYLYKDTAQLTVDTESRTPGQITNNITKQLNL